MSKVQRAEAPSKKPTAPKVVATPPPKPVRAIPAISGGRATPQGKASSVVNKRAADFPRFILTHRAEKWDYVPAMDSVLPVFSPIRLVPGIGNINSKGQSDMALVQAQKMGAVIIYEEDVEGGYLRTYPMLGGVGYLPRWDEVRQHGALVDIETNWDAFTDFCALLLHSGTIRMPNEIVLRTVRRKYQDERRLAVKTAKQGSEAAREETEMCEKALACIDRMLNDPDAVSTLRGGDRVNEGEEIPVVVRPGEDA